MEMKVCVCVCVLNVSCLSYSEGLLNFDEDLDIIEVAAGAEDYSPFPQSSDDDETSTDGMWGCGLQGTFV